MRAVDSSVAASGLKLRPSTISPSGLNDRLGSVPFAVQRWMRSYPHGLTHGATRMSGIVTKEGKRVENGMVLQMQCRSIAHAYCGHI